MPLFAYSKAALCVRPMMACLLAEYAVRPGASNNSSDGRTVHNGSAALSHHLTKFALHAVPRSTEIDVDEAVKDLVVSLRHGRCDAIDTGVVESSIELAISLDGRLIMAAT